MCKSNNVKFRIYEYDLPPSMGKGGNQRDSNDGAKYHDTGKEISVSEDDAREFQKVTGYAIGNPFYSYPYFIPAMLLHRMGFCGQFANGWMINWLVQYDEGYIGSPGARYWHLKRVV